jgi:hypothetical protein
MAVLRNYFERVRDKCNALFAGYDTCNFDAQRRVITVTADGVCIRVSPSLDDTGKIIVIIVQSFDGRAFGAVFHVTHMSMITTNENFVVASVNDDDVHFSDIESTVMDICNANRDVLETLLLLE